MCLIICAFKYQPDFPLVLAANRDEFFSRPARAAGFWSETPESTGILAGKDLEQGGTWLGINHHGRFAAVTNIRNPQRSGSGKKSRGFLARDFLGSDLPISNYVQGLRASVDLFAGFNLLLGDRECLYYLNNSDGKIYQLEPGLYGLSNGVLDEPWPKVVRGKRRLQAILDAGNTIDTDNLLAIMTDKDIAPDAQLPDTGVSLELERQLSASLISIRERDYGTRCSTAIVIDDQGRIKFNEQNYKSDSSIASRYFYDFNLLPLN